MVLIETEFELDLKMGRFESSSFVSTVIAASTLILYLQSCKTDDIDQCRLEEVVTPFIAPCKTTRDLDTIKMFINGRWTWLQEERVQRGQPIRYLTPKLEGYSLELKLKNDTATYYKCNQIDSQYRFAVIKWKDVPGAGTAGFPEGEWPVLIYYDLKTGVRAQGTPVKICSTYLILQYQYVSSIVGPYTWKRLSN